MVEGDGVVLRRPRGMQPLDIQHPGGERRGDVDGVHLAVLQGLKHGTERFPPGPQDLLLLFGGQAVDGRQVVDVNSSHDNTSFGWVALFRTGEATKVQGKEGESRVPGNAPGWVPRCPFASLYPC